MADPTIDTLNAICQKYFIEKNLVDNVFKSTPVFDALKPKMKPGGSTEVTFDIEYARVTTGKRDYNETRVLSASPEIATQGKMGWSHYWADVNLEQLEIDYNNADPRRIANYLDMYVRSAVQAMREDQLSPDIFTDQTGKAMYSLTDAINDSASYGNLNNTWTGMGQWRCVVGESSYGTPSVPLAPSLENFSKMIRLIKAISKKEPNLIITSGDVFDRLREQINANDRVSAVRQGDNVGWGYTDLGVDGVPVVVDLDFEAQQCAAYDTGESTRAACAGHQALFVNWEHLYLYYLPARNMSWDRMGWQATKGATDYFNTLYWTGNVVCTARREQGRLFGIDPTMDIDSANWVLIPDSQTNKSNFVS